MATDASCPSPPTSDEDGQKETSTERAALDAALASVLAGRAIGALADGIGTQATAHRPGYLIVVAGRAGQSRVYGRDITLPRRAVLALDRVATGTAPGPSAVLGGATWAASTA